MSDNYYLKIGGSDFLGEQLIKNLSSADEGTKKKAEDNLCERLKETRVRIGTLLKTDNVSFLIGAGASMKAGGVGLASIPTELEKMLHEKSKKSDENKDLDWMSLFYATASSVLDQTFNSEERGKALSENLSEGYCQLFCVNLIKGQIGPHLSYRI